MSAYGIGTTAFVLERARSVTHAAAAKAEVDPTLRKNVVEAVAPTQADGLGIIIKWVPGEVIGAYGAIVAALQPDKKGTITGTGWGWLAAACVGAFLLTVLGGVVAFRRVKTTGRMPYLKRMDLIVRGLLAAVGLLLWSYIIPGSTTNQSDFALTNASAVLLAVPFSAVVFGLFAEMLVLPTSMRALGKIFK